MNGAYMQQGMMLQQNAQMIGSLGGHMPGSDRNIGQQVAGRAVNIGSAVGGAGMALGAGMAGLDPLSMALSGASKGFSAGGFGGGLVGGLAMGGLSMGIGAGVSYAADQMTRGIQQQQQLHQMMGQSFKFQNQFGGSGFTGGETRQIGAGIANMQGWSGPGGSGSMVGFEELSRLASGMGAMGMGQGVKSVQDFSKRFKEMLTSVKTIAHEMQTSLEEAQKVMGDMRQSGVFGAGNAANVSKQIRAAAIGGNVSTAEVTAMMGVGSQIARMSGGLGRQGANAGIRSIGQVGAAVEAGVLSEESIYNATGLTGAEGKQAFAQQGLQQTDKFLRTAQGRYFMASVAGHGGKLDEGSIQQYLAGGVSPEDTKNMANRNLAKIGAESSGDQGRWGRPGQVDFTRNEGRLRGAVMERLGVLAPAMSMKGWLESRGIDINDDRAKLYLQRARGMGRDEADNMVEMAKNIPQILEQQKTATRNDDITRSIVQAKSRTGVEGIKRKFEEAKEHVEKSLQEPARAMMNWAETSLNEFAADFTGQFLAVQQQNVEGLVKAAKGTGAGAKAARQMLLGNAGGSASWKKMLSDQGGTAGLGFGKSVGASFMTDSGDVESLAKAGFNLNTTERKGRASTWRNDADIAKQMDRFRSISEGVAEGAGGQSEFGKAHAMELMEYAGLTGMGKGTQVLDRYKDSLTKMAAKGDKGAAAELKKFNAAANPGDQAKMASSAMASAGFDITALAAMPETTAITAMRSQSTESEFRRSLGEKMLGSDKVEANNNFFGKGGALDQVFGGNISELTGHRGAGAITKGMELFGGGGQMDRQASASAIGTAMESKEYMEMAEGVFSGSEAAKKGAAAKMASLRAGDEYKKAGTAAQGEFDATGRLMMAADLREAMAGGDVSPKDKAMLMEKYKDLGIKSFDDMKKIAATVGNHFAGVGGEKAKAAIKYIAEDSRKDKSRMMAAGLVDEKTGEVSADVLKAVGGKDSKAGQLLMAKAQAAIEGSKGTGVGADLASTATGKASELLRGMSDQEMASYEKGVGADPVAAGEIKRERSERRRLARGGGAGQEARGMSILAGELGVKVSNEDLMGAQKQGKKGRDALIQQMISNSGVTDEASVKKMTEAATAYVDKKDSSKLRGVLDETAGVRAEKKKHDSVEAAKEANPVGAETNKHLQSLNKTQAEALIVAKSTLTTSQMIESNNNIAKAATAAGGEAAGK